MVAPRGVRCHAEQHVRRPLQQARGPVGLEQQRGRVTGVGPAQDAGGSRHAGRRLLHPGHDRGGQGRDPGLAQCAVERAEHLVGIAAVECRGDAAEHVPQLPRHSGRGPVVAGDVADDERRVTFGGDERVVPVAADLHLLCRGPVADGDLEMLELRGTGQQRPLEALGEAARGPCLTTLGLAAGHPVDGLGALSGEGLEDTEVVVVEGLGSSQPTVSDPSGRRPIRSGRAAQARRPGSGAAGPSSPASRW